MSKFYKCLETYDDDGHNRGIYTSDLIAEGKEREKCMQVYSNLAHSKMKVEMSDHAGIFCLNIEGDGQVQLVATEEQMKTIATSIETYFKDKDMEVK